LRRRANLALKIYMEGLKCADFGFDEQIKTVFTRIMIMCLQCMKRVTFKSQRLLTVSFIHDQKVLDTSLSLTVVDEIFGLKSSPVWRMDRLVLN